MACSLNMQIKNETPNITTFMNPRISFSNDFTDPNHHHEINTYREAPVSSDFEFSVPSFSANSADEVFFKGKLPPLKEKVVTLRDELLAGDEDDDDDDGNGVFQFYNSKNSTGWWKEKFRLGKNQNGNRKREDKSFRSLETIDEAKIKSSNSTGSNKYK